MKIPDYISPVVGHRVWRWDEKGLKSLNGEPWLPGQHLEARCRVASAAFPMAEAANEVPHRKCTCGIYAAKNREHLRQLGYADHGIYGEVYLWGSVVEHKLGWRAQFGYPKNLVLPPHLLPFSLAELDARLQALIAFRTDTFALRNGESIRLWKHEAGYDVGGLDYIINMRKKHYVRQREDRTLKTGDRVAVQSSEANSWFGTPSAFRRSHPGTAYLRRRLRTQVDDLWWWADASDSNTIDIANLAPGEHKVRIVLVDATHNPFPGQEVTLRFTIPEGVPVSHSH